MCGVWVCFSSLEVCEAQMEVSLMLSWAVVAAVAGEHVNHGAFCCFRGLNVSPPVVAAQGEEGAATSLLVGSVRKHCVI